MGLNVVLVTVEGGLVQDTTNLHGETEVIVLDWDTIDNSSSASSKEAMEQIAHYKLAIYPWREQVPGVWEELLRSEAEWLDGADSDNNLTYHYAHEDHK